MTKRITVKADQVSSQFRFLTIDRETAILVPVGSAMEKRMTRPGDAFTVTFLNTKDEVRQATEGTEHEIMCDYTKHVCKAVKPTPEEREELYNTFVYDGVQYESAIPSEFFIFVEDPSDLDDMSDDITGEFN